MKETEIGSELAPLQRYGDQWVPEDSVHDDVFFEAIAECQVRINARRAGDIRKLEALAHEMHTGALGYEEKKLLAIIERMKEAQQ